jgi:Protein of unknown function (DUF935)
VGAAGSKPLLVARLAAWNKLQAFDIGITPEIATARVRAASFSATAQTRLFETMLARDADLGNAVDQRTLALAEANWRFVPREDVDESAARPVLDALPDELLSQEILEHAALFRLFGYALIEIEWAPDWSVVGLHEWPYAASEILNGDVRVYVDGMQVSVEEPEYRDRFIVLRASKHDPAGAARLRRCVGLWLTRSYLARDWRAYLERFGDPLLIGKYDDSMPPSPEGVSPQQTVLEALAQLKSSAIAALPKSVEADLLADSRTDATQAFDRLWERCSDGMYNAVLGQNSTVRQGTSGARSSDEVRERVLDSLIEADARIIAATVRRDLIAKVEAAKVGGRKLVQLESTWERAIPQETRAQIMVAAKNAGIDFDFDAAREELGLQPPSEEQLAAKAEAAAQMQERLAGLSRPQPAAGDGKQEPGTPGEPDKPTMNMAERLLAAVRAVFSRDAGVEAYRAGAGTMNKALDSISEASKPGVHKALERGLLETLRANLRDDMTPAEVDEVFRQALTAGHVRPVAEVFERALLAARLNGRLLAAAQLARLRKRQGDVGAA